MGFCGVANNLAQSDLMKPRYSQPNALAGK